MSWVTFICTLADLFMTKQNIKYTFWVFQTIFCNHCELYILIMYYVLQYWFYWHVTERLNVQVPYQCLFIKTLQEIPQVFKIMFYVLLLNKIHMGCVFWAGALSVISGVLDCVVSRVVFLIINLNICSACQLWTLMR